jgi:antitoxin VapB
MPEKPMKTARLFPNGQSQAVRLPKEFRFEGDHVYVQRVGNGVVLLPAQAPWRTLFASLAEFTPDFGQETFLEARSFQEGVSSQEGRDEDS